MGWWKGVKKFRKKFEVIIELTATGNKKGSTPTGK